MNQYQFLFYSDTSNKIADRYTILDCKTGNLIYQQKLSNPVVYKKLDALKGFKKFPMTV